MRRKGQQAENDKTERVTGLGRRTKEEIAKWNQMTALRFQTGGRHQTSPASLQGVPIQQKQFKMKDLASFQYQNCRQNWGESCLTHSTSYCTALTTDNCLWDQFKKIFSIHIHGQHYWQTAKTLCWHMDSVVFSLINIGVQSKRSEPDLFHSLYCLFWCYIDAVLMLYWCCIDAILMLYWWLFVFVFLNPVGSEW